MICMFIVYMALQSICIIIPLLKNKVLFPKTIILPYFIVDNLILNLMYTDRKESGLQHNKGQIGTHIAFPTQRKKDRE